MSRVPVTHGSGGGLARESAGEASLREVLAWQRAVLSAATVPELLTAASLPPGSSVPMTATLLLSDPTHELRHLLFGDGRAPAHPGVRFCDSLVAVAPQLAVLSDPWRGPFRASEHGVLFPEATGVESAILFPLHSSGALVGCLSLGAGPGARVPCEGDPWVLAHVADIVSVAIGRLLDGMRLRRGGFTNPLTGWHTRRFLESRLKEAVARCERHGGDISCVLIDVDGLKPVNDAYGQLAGDQALREIAARIEGELRASDATAHLGADQFVVLLLDTRVDLAVPLAERVLDAVRSEPVQAGPGLALPMSVSIGLAAVAAGLDAGQKSLANQLLAKAEVALHMAKARGGNRYAVADG